MSEVKSPADTCLGLLQSACSIEGVGGSIEDTVSWMKDRVASHPFAVEPIELSNMDAWKFEEATGDIVHETGRFFRVEGLSAIKNYGDIREWQQPIINQQEIGILGFLSRDFDGLRHFLVQAKMEPGNINTIQLSPTVQATHSNYTQVHKGKLPRYLDYFLDPGKSILIDQLQSEQGTRFLRKRNRNIIIDCPEDIELHDDFRWMTLGQLKALIARDYHINMEARSILSCISLTDDAGLVSAHAARAVTSASKDNPTFRDRLITSGSERRQTRHSIEEVLQWMTEMKSTYYMRSRTLNLRDLAGGWQLEDKRLRHESGKYFSIMAVQVSAGSREVPDWTQPLIDSVEEGITGWICRSIEGILHFLTKIRLEPGTIDLAELSPTVASTDGKHCVYENNPPQFLDVFLSPPSGSLRHDSRQSAEGGRFFQDTSHCLILEIDDFPLDVPENFKWLTLGQLQSLMHNNNIINVETRDLLSCLDIRAS